MSASEATLAEEGARQVWGVAEAHTYARERSITTVYKGAEIPAEYEWRGPRTCVVELRTRHDKYRKEYVSAAHLVHYAGGMVSEMIGLTGHGIRTYVAVSTAPAARFSAKTLAALHAEAVREFEALPEDDPTRAWATAWLEGRGK